MQIIQFYHNYLIVIPNLHFPNQLPIPFPNQLSHYEIMLNTIILHHNYFRYQTTEQTV